MAACQKRLYAHKVSKRQCQAISLHQPLSKGCYEKNSLHLRRLSALAKLQRRKMHQCRNSWTQSSNLLTSATSNFSLRPRFRVRILHFLRERAYNPLKAAGLCLVLEGAVYHRLKKAVPGQCRFPFVCVSIGLTIRKQVVVGVVYNPILKEVR